MRSIFQVLILLILSTPILIFSQCSGSSSSSGNGGETTEANLTGNWTGTWSSYSQTASGSMQANITHSDDSINGTISITGSPCITNGSISGTISGNNIYFGVVSEADTINFTATYSSSLINGTYSVNSGDCAGDSGIFTLNKGTNGEEPLITTLVSGLSYPSHLLVKDTNLFWSDNSDTPIKNMSLSDGNFTSVVKRLGDPENVIIDGQNLYWIGSGRTLIKSKLDGTESTILAEGENSVSEMRDIIVDDTNVYWANSTASPNTYTIEKVPKVGGESTILVSTTKPILSMVRDETHLYWQEEKFTDPGFIKKMPLGGGEESIVFAGTDQVGGFVGDIVLQGSDIFVAEVLYPYPYSGARLYKISITDGSATIIGDLPVLPKKLAVDKFSVYWIDESSVNSIPINGGSITTLASGLNSPVDLALDSANVYWVETVCCAHGQTGSIKKVPIAGGTMSILVDGVDAPQVIALDSSNIYWIEGGPIGQIEGFGRIAMIPIDGGAGSTIISALIGGSMPIAVDNTHVYIADRWTIKKVSHDGGTVEKLVIANFYIKDIATDGVNVYWIEDGPIAKVAKVSINGGIEEILSNEIVGPSGPITVDNTYVFWMAHYDTIARVSINGGPTEVITAGLPFLSDFAVDGTHVYFSEQDTGYIRKVSINDGIITELIGGLFPFTWRKLAVDNQNLYWIDQTDVRKIPIDGGSSTSIVGNIQSDATFPNSIVVDDTSIYWTEVGSGEVKMTQPK